MRIATWNVNSVRARLPRLLAWLDDQEPDVVCLQETKCLDDVFPLSEIEDLGYHVETFGQRTYNGVAILSRTPMEECFRGFPDDEDDADRRVIGATIDGVQILNLYVVNGQEVGSEKYEYKLAWLDRLHSMMAEYYDPSEMVVVTGDFNITFDDRDVYNPERWREKILCSTPEREALGRLMDLGFHDALRRQQVEGGIYTWFDFRTRGFERGQGLRIDHFLMSESAALRCSDVYVDLDERGQEKPSDHAPVIATLDGV